MKKEVVIAIFIGLVLGLIVTYGIYRAKTSLSSTQQAASTTNEASPTPSGLHNALTLLAPDDESVQDTSDVKVTGTTDPNALVVIFMNNTPQVIDADKSGNFSIQTTLDQGSNVITVRTLDDQGNTAEEQRTVIYSTASLEETATPSASVQPSPTPAGKSASPSPSVNQ